MPSSPNYKRNYKQEAATESKARQKYRLERNEARREMIKAGAVKRNDGKDVDHKQPLSKGGTNSMANLRVLPASKNRSYPRTSTGKIKGK